MLFYVIIACSIWITFNLLLWWSTKIAQDKAIAAQETADRAKREIEHIKERLTRGHL